MLFSTADIQFLLEGRIDFTALSAVEFLCVFRHKLIQLVQINVCKDGADDRALRSTGVSIVVVPVLHISGFQKLPEQTNKMLVRNPLAQNGNQHMVVYIVKTALYVALNKPFCPREIFLHILECRMAAFVHAEAVGVVAEGWLIDTLQNEPHHLLYQFVVE